MICLTLIAGFFFFSVLTDGRHVSGVHFFITEIVFVLLDDELARGVPHGARAAPGAAAAVRRRAAQATAAAANANAAMAVLVAGVGKLEFKV